MVNQGLAIRLARHGCTNRPFYQIVVMNKRRARNSKPQEQLGTYDPMPNSQGQILVGLNFDRLKFWIGKGAVPTKPIDQLLGLSGFYPIHPMTYITANRNRKAAVEAEHKEIQQESADADTDSTSTDS